VEIIEDVRLRSGARSWSDWEHCVRTLSVKPTNMRHRALCGEKLEDRQLSCFLRPSTSSHIRHSGLAIACVVFRFVESKSEVSPRDCFLSLFGITGSALSHIRRSIYEQGKVLWGKEAKGLHILLASL
jgi:hypothetical protein